MATQKKATSTKMSRRQLFSRLVPPSVKEMAEKAHPDAEERQAQKKAEAAAQAEEDARQERRLTLAREGNVALASGNIEGAVTHFRTFVKEAPKEAMPHLCLGRCLYDIGQYIQARVEFKRAMDIAQQGPGHVRDHATLFLGLTLLRMDRREKAHALWQSWHPEGVPVLAEALEPVLTRLGQNETAGDDLASCIAEMEAATAKTPWAHLPPLVPTHSV